MRTAEKDKLAALGEWGGACQRCGYNRCNRALQFHHKDPSQKFGRVTVREARAHPERFELLCANCHFEEHDAQDKARAINHPCRYCGKPVKMEAARLADGRGKYCSRKCQSADRVAHSKSLAEVFWKRVQKTDSCWLWIGFKDPNGYGRLNRYGTPVLAHRISWELHNGPIPESMNVLHNCPNPSCMRPDHLFLGTDTDKMQEASKKGHTTRGERSGHSKLTEPTVTEIRARYAAGNISQAKLSKEYGVCQATISELIRGLIWTHTFNL